jgi:hypothetical protein
MFALPSRRFRRTTAEPGYVRAHRASGIALHLDELPEGQHLALGTHIVIRRRRT